MFIKRRAFLAVPLACACICNRRLSAQTVVPDDQPVPCATPQILPSDRIRVIPPTYVPLAARPDGMLVLRPLTGNPTQDDVRLEDYATMVGGDAWRPSDGLPPVATGLVRLGVSFLDGSSEQRDLVRRTAPEWARPGRAWVEFVFDVPPQQAHIRITFNTRVNESHIGRHAKAIAAPAPTMWLHVVGRPEYSAVTQHRIILHEFGHALGLRHEHQHPNGGIPWNRRKTVAYYEKHYGWDEDKVRDNVFTVFDRSYACGPPDRQSVMFYDVDPELTDGKFAVIAASTISDVDGACMARMYSS